MRPDLLAVRLAHRARPRAAPDVAEQHAAQQPVHVAAVQDPDDDLLARVAALRLADRALAQPGLQRDRGLVQLGAPLRRPASMRSTSSVAWPHGPRAGAAPAGATRVRATPGAEDRARHVRIRRRHHDDRRASPTRPCVSRVLRAASGTAPHRARRRSAAPRAGRTRRCTTTPRRILEAREQRRHELAQVRRPAAPPPPRPSPAAAPRRGAARARPPPSGPSASAPSRTRRGPPASADVVGDEALHHAHGVAAVHADEAAVGAVDDGDGVRAPPRTPPPDRRSCAGSAGRRARSSARRAPRGSRRAGEVTALQLVEQQRTRSRSGRVGPARGSAAAPAARRPGGRAASARCRGRAHGPPSPAGRAGSARSRQRALVVARVQVVPFRFSSMRTRMSLRSAFAGTPAAWDGAAVHVVEQVLRLVLEADHARLERVDQQLQRLAVVAHQEVAGKFTPCSGRPSRQPTSR
jgi:hypothetical protein